MRRVSLAAARRAAVRAQDLDGARDRPVSKRDVLRVARRQGVVQIDSVDVVARAHLMPVFSRLGAYEPALLTRAAEGRDRALFEYWGHEASLLPVEMQPLLRWRMADARAGVGVYGTLRRYAAENRAEIEAVRRRLDAEGPLAASDWARPRRIDRAADPHASWWGWSGPKRALEWLFWAGEIGCHGRRANFERVYAPLERCLPAAVLDAPTPARERAHRALLMKAAARLGVASIASLADYHRLPLREVRPRLDELVEEGLLEPVAVEGWKTPAFRAAAAPLPRALKTSPAALLSPFDPLVWHRPRGEALFGFTYRLEIYVPAAKRVHGYYVLPFLEGDRLSARCCLKADRKAGRLIVRTAYGEAGIDPDRTARALAGELARMAAWLGLDDVAVMPGASIGDLAAPLRRAIG